jgi:hypothetical protein
MIIFIFTVLSRKIADFQLLQISLTSMMITMILKNPTVITARKRVSAVF